MPITAGAVSMADLQARIQSLLSVVASLQQQLAWQNTVTTPSTTYPVTIPNGTRPWWCGTYADLSFGSYSNRVVALHKAMGVGVLGVSPTGYYGSLTSSAWSRWCGQTSPAPLPDPAYDPAADYSCKAWYDGCNSCSRSYSGAPSICTARACVWKAPAYCTERFGSTSNRPPTVSSLSGPSVMTVNQVGTWRVNASDPENGQLTYSISWGDEYGYRYDANTAPSAVRAFQQSTTFTHSYASAGTYTVSITVRDVQGLEARTTTTVRVDNNNTICTLEYAPVCGQPQFYCPAGAYCPQVMPAQKTYSNICQLNAENATLVSYGACNQSGLHVCQADAYCMCDSAGRMVLCQ